MKNGSNVSLAAAALVAGSLPVIALGRGAAIESAGAAGPDSGTIQRGNGQYAPGDDTTILLGHPSTSPLR